MIGTIAIHRLAGAPSAAEARRTPSRRADAMPQMPERELAQRFAAGDMAAIEQMVNEHHASVARLLGRMLGWQHHAAVEDLAQEVFVRAIESRHRFNGNASLRTWLTSIAINQCRAHLRKHARRRVLLKLWHAGQPTRLAPAADTATTNDETCGEVRHAVAQLAPKYREVAVLFYLEELSIDEVAAAVGTTPGAVATRLSRARQKLRQLLDKSLLGESLLEESPLDK